MRVNVKKIVIIYCVVIGFICLASLKIFILGYQGSRTDLWTVGGMLLLLPIFVLTMIAIVTGLCIFLSGVAKDAEENYKDGYEEFHSGFDVATKFYSEAISVVFKKKGLIKIIAEINREAGENIIELTKKDNNEQEEKEK